VALTAALADEAKPLFISTIFAPQGFRTRQILGKMVHTRGVVGRQQN
jgi:hypothetical protein